MSAREPDDFTRPVKDLCKIGATYVGMIVSTIIVLWTLEPIRAPSRDVELLTSQHEFDKWLALNDFFRSGNRTFFEGDSWPEFLGEAIERPIGYVFEKIDVIKQVQSGTEVKQPKDIVLTAPFQTFEPTRINLKIDSKNPLILSVAMRGFPDREFNYDLVFIDSRSPSHVVGSGHGIVGERAAKNYIQRDFLARPRDAAQIIAGLRRNGWRAEPTNFDELTAGNDIVGAFMRERSSHPAASSASMIKLFGFDIPRGWIGIALPIACITFLVIMMKAVVDLTRATLNRRTIWIKKPDDIPYLMQDAVLRAIASSVPLLLTLSAFWIVWDRLPMLLSDPAFVDFGVRLTLLPMIMVWMLVATVAVVGRFQFEPKND
jgi:hypothetical protein